MKICMLLKANDFLNDNRVRKEAAALVAAGHEVTVLAKKTPRSLEHEVYEGADVIRIPPVFWDPRRLFLEKAVELKADAYHAHDLYTLDIAVVAASRTDAYVIYDSHELWTSLLKHYWNVRYVRRLFYWMRERFLIRKADAVITVSDSIARVLQKKYHLRDVVVLRNVPPPAVDITQKDLRKLLPIGADQKIVVHIGGIIEARGLPRMIEALCLCDRLVFVCIGAGLVKNSYTAKLEKLALKLGVEKRVHFLPHMPFAEMIAYASSADFGYCLMQPITQHHYLTLTNKFFDYFLARLPVIASNFPEMKNLIDKYHVGWAIPHDDSSNLARILTEIIENPHIYEEMKQNTARALEENNWAIESKKLVDLYERLPGKRPKVSFRRWPEPSAFPPAELLILTACDPSQEAIANLRKSHQASHVALAVIGPSTAHSFKDDVEAYFPLKSPAEFLNFMKMVSTQKRTAEYVTVYQKPNFRHLLLFDLLLLPAVARRKFVYFPNLNLSYRIGANIFLQKYVNRLETKLYFLLQFLKILQAPDSGTSGRGAIQ
jgi:glycosyltransferase involved in cell wall biosynthesis